MLLLMITHLVAVYDSDTVDNLLASLFVLLCFVLFRFVSLFSRVASTYRVSLSDIFAITQQMLL
jgi:lipopolysaccharide export LptBFGC system permease protein LptF